MENNRVAGGGEPSGAWENPGRGGVSPRLPGSHAVFSPRKPRRMAWLVLALGLLLTGVATLRIKADVEKNEAGEFAARTEEMKQAIAARFDDHSRFLQSAAAFFNASDEVTREKWRIFIESQDMQKQLPGIQGVGFAQLIPAAELAEHIQKVRGEGFPEYTVKPAGERVLYSSIVYLEPFSGRNLRAFGYDMLTEPIRQAALKHARDTGRPMLTGKVTLVQETGKEVQPGTLLFMPVYRKGMPTASILQRRAAIFGWVYSPYRMSDLMEGIFAEYHLGAKSGVSLEVYDGDTPFPSSLLYAKGASAGRPDTFQRRLSQDVSLEVHGRRWTLRFSQAAESLFSVSFIGVWLTGVGGVVVTLLMFALLDALLNTHRQAQRLAKKMTWDLQKSEEALRQATSRLSLAVRAGGVGIWEYDVASERLLWDDQMLRLYGLARGAFNGAYGVWKAGMHPDDRERIDDEVRLALRGEKDFDTEFRVLWPDQTVRHIRGFAYVERDGDGQPLRMVGTNWDITDRIAAEESIKRQASLINSLLDSIPDIIFFKDVNGVYLGCNPPFAEFVGRPKEAIVGRTDYDLFPAPVAVFFREHDRRMLERREPRHNEEWVTYPDGRKKMLDTLKTPYWSPEGSLIGILGISRDITAGKEAEDALRKSEAKVSLLLNSTAEAIYGIDLAGNCIFANPACLRMLGYDRLETLLGRNMHDLIHHSYADGHAMPNEVCRIYRVFREGLGVHVDDEVLWKADGSHFPAEYWSYPMRGEAGEITGSVVTFVDITQRKQAETSLAAERQRLEYILEGTNVGTWEWNVQTGAIAVNARWAEIVGRTLAELSPVTLEAWTGLVHPDDYSASRALLDKHFRREIPHYECEVRMRHKNGSWIWVLDRGKVATWTADGRPLVMSGTHMDITERKQAEETIRHLATHDALTDLPTLRLAKDRLSMALGLARRHKTAVAVMFVDLDGFKEVNDTFGHAAGDEVLRQVSQRLLTCLRGTDTIARVGGDEFLLVTTEMHSGDDAAIIASKVQACVSRPVFANGQRILIGASIGISLYPDQGSDADRLISLADEAMYRVKKSGKNGFAFASDIAP